MHSSRFMKLSGIILAITLVVLAGFQTASVNAGPLAQGTASVEATTAAGGGAGAAATTSAGAGTSATAAGTMSYPPCPPATMEGTVAAATAAASMAATTGAEVNATAAATVAATAAAHAPGYLGVRAEQVADCGVRVVEVVAGQAAATAGIQEGDVIVAMNGTATTSITQLRLAIEAAAPGDKVTLTVQRNGQQMDIQVTLGERPPDTTATEAAGGAATSAAATAAATQ